MRSRSLYYNTDGEASTACTVIDDPRVDAMKPTGILNAEGHMIMKVTKPITIPVGFHIPNANEDADEKISYVPKNMIDCDDEDE